MKKYEFIMLTIFTILTIVSCNKRELNSGKFIVTKKIEEFISTDGKDVFLSKITAIKKYNNKIYLLDGRNKYLYILNQKYKIIKEYNLNNYDYLFKGQILDFIITKDFVLFADNSFNLKKMLFDTGIITNINYGKLENGSSFISSMVLLSDTTFVVSTGHIRPDYPDNLNEYIIGAKYLINGKLVHYYKIKLNKEEILPFNFIEKSYVSVNNNTVYFNFANIRKVFQFTKSNSLVRHYELSIDPSISKIEKHGNKIKTMPIAYGPLAFYKDDFYLYKYRGKNNIPAIVRYKTNTNNFTEYSIEKLPSILPYKLYIIDKNLIIVNYLTPVLYIVNFNK